MRSTRKHKRKGKYDHKNKNKNKRHNITKAKNRYKNRTINNESTLSSRNTRKKHKIKSNTIYVGMLTVPLNPSSKLYRICGTSYVVTAHIEWLKTHNIEIIPIPYYSKNLHNYIKKVHGLYLPSGGVFAQTQPEYYYAAKKLIHLAKQQNDMGNYFPVWGACMGFQQMLIVQDGNDNYHDFLQKFDSDKNLYLPLIFTDEGYNSRIFSEFSKSRIKDMNVKKCSLHNHKMGISPTKFKRNKNLSSFYKIVNTSYDRNNKPFVSTIEAYDYPFYGVQWHPERKQSFFPLSIFFAKELRKNKKNIISKKNNHTLKQNRVKCMKYSNDIYKKCDFFYEQNDTVVDDVVCNYVADHKKDSNGRIYTSIG